MASTDNPVDRIFQLQSLLPIIALLFGLTLLVLLIGSTTLQLLAVWRAYRVKYLCLEITPPATTDKSPKATTQLFIVLHGLLDSRPLIHKILRRKPVFALEVVSTRKNGIRFILRAPESQLNTYKQLIHAYLPDAKTKVVEDYLADFNYGTAKIASYRQSGHFAYPLRAQASLDEHDPIAYLGSAMTQLGENELVALQLVVSPVRNREAISLQNRLAHNELLVTRIGKRSSPLLRALHGISSALYMVTGTIGDLFHGPTHLYTPQIRSSLRRYEIAIKERPARTLSPIEQKLADSVQYKLSQPLFQVSIRAVAMADSMQGSKSRVSGISQALGAMGEPKYQSLKKQRPYPVFLRWQLSACKFRLSPVWMKSSNVLAASELASLYHFPHSQSGQVENVVTSLSKQLPAPLSLKNGTEFDVVIGQNNYHGQTTDIGMTAAERERHVFIVGGTGNGKTTMLKYAIVQDIRNGKGVAVIDPHGDLAQELLALIPKERINDVVYFNPADLSYPIGLNLLEVPEGLTGDQLLKAKDFIAETVVSIMRKTFSDDGTGGHRIEYVLRNAVLTALTVKDATLFTVYDILTNNGVRKPIVGKLEQEWLKNFWNNEYGKAGDYQQVKMMAGVTSKIGRYHASVSAERILEQPKSTIDFEEILNGKILICNLAKGLIGEDTSEVFGVSILAKLQLASYMRIEQKQVDRRPFYAYVDEFQNFATVSFTQMLSESRKYKLFLIMAEQTTAQQDDENMVNTIMANAGTIICFKSNSLADEKRMLHLFNGKVIPGEIANLPSFNFYAKLSGGLEPQDPVSGMTVVVEEAGSVEIADCVVEASRARYAKKYEVPKPKKKIVESKQDKVKNNVANDVSSEGGRNRPGDKGDGGSE